MMRLPDWRLRLHRYLRETHGHAIVPGQHDCCLFGAGGIQAQTGVDLAAGWRGRYTTFAGGRRVLRKAGYADHVDLIARHLTEAHPVHADEGDIAVVPVEDGLAVGIVQGAAVYVLTADGRLGFAPMTGIQRLFKVS
jgi:hypothetical protein